MIDHPMIDAVERELLETQFRRHRRREKDKTRQRFSGYRRRLREMQRKVLTFDSVEATEPHQPEQSIRNLGRPRTITDDTVQAVCKASRAGRTQKEIAAMTGVSHTSVSRILRREAARLPPGPVRRRQEGKQP